jgi:hypothetical protein
MSTTPPAPLRTSEPDPPRNEPAGPRYLECDFCHCKLTRTGEVYQVSPEAREFRDANEKHKKQVEKLDEEMAKLREQIAAKDAEIAALKGSSALRRAGIEVR